MIMWFYLPSSSLVVLIVFQNSISIIITLFPSYIFWKHLKERLFYTVQNNTHKQLLQAGRYKNSTSFLPVIQLVE